MPFTIMSCAATARPSIRCRRGTKAACLHVLRRSRRRPIGRLRLRLLTQARAACSSEFDEIVACRRREADEFYADLQHDIDRPRRARRAAPGVRRHDLEQAVLLLRRAGVAQGDPGQPPPPPERRQGRNREWTHLNNADIISMPDKWEYPWYAAWDLAFHCIPLALVDPEFAKEQLVLLHARMVHAPQRSDAGLRVGVRRRQSAGARLGGLAGLPDRPQAARRQRRPGVPRARLPQADAELHLVGQSQGRRRAETSSRADSSAWTTSASSTAARRCPTAAISTRPTAPAGWRCTA